MTHLRKTTFVACLLPLFLTMACSSGSGGDDGGSGNPDLTAVPSITGLVQADAETRLTGAGLAVGSVTIAASDSVPAGQVISQSPQAGAMVAAGTAVAFTVSSGTPTAAAPDVEGQSETDAISAITNAGFVTGSITRQNDDNVPVNTVISQDPAPGTTLDVGSSIDLVISLGPMDTAIPDVVGRTEAQATADITGAGFAVGTISRQTDASVPADAVISQDPAGGTLAGAGATVDLVVSLGSGSVTVPDVVGMTESQAGQAISGAGLVVGTTTRQNDASIPAGDVISQAPVGGTMVSSGSAVDLVVSDGPDSSGFSDEFDSNSLSEWSLRHVVEGTAAQYSTLDINQTVPGALTIVPGLTPGWFDSDDGPLVFKNIDGNFSVHTRLVADSLSSPGNPPGSNFNSAGLMARNPAGASGPENYIMLNIGRQRVDSGIPSGVGSETKTTVNSNSTLFLDDGASSGDLVLCRIGNDFHSFRMLAGESGWTLTDSFNRPDLPSSLQVGMVVNAFNSPADLRAEFDFIRLLGTPSNLANCTP